MGHIRHVALEGTFLSFRLEDLYANKAKIIKNQHDQMYKIMTTKRKLWCASVTYKMHNKWSYSGTFLCVQAQLPVPTARPMSSRLCLCPYFTARVQCAGHIVRRSSSQLFQNFKENPKWKRTEIQTWKKWCHSRKSNTAKQQGQKLKRMT